MHLQTDKVQMKKRNLYEIQKIIELLTKSALKGNKIRYSKYMNYAIGSSAYIMWSRKERNKTYFFHLCRTDGWFVVLCNNKRKY